MSHSTDAFFYIAFLGQIFVISLFLPNTILGRARQVLEKYPPGEYPKLYPRPAEHYRIGLWIFQAITRGTFVLGLVLCVLLATKVDHASFADDGFISELWPAAFGIFQFLPLIVLEILGFQQTKLMREANISPLRKADLRRRGLFDHISPTAVGLGVAFLLATIVFDLYVHEFSVGWGSDTAQRAFVLVATNGFMIGMAAWQYFGKKRNPHQAQEDRARETTVGLRSILYVSIAMSLFYMTLAADDVYDLDFLDAALISLYFQVIVFVSIGNGLRNVTLENTDFAVYRKDPVTG